MSNNSNKEKFISQAQKLVEKGQFDKAIREYLKIVAEDENDIRIWIRIGDLYVKLGQKNEAVENYKKVAQLYVQQGDPEKSIAVYKRILEISPQAVDAHLSLGGLYREQGRIGHATQQYELAAQALYRQGKIRESLRAEQAIVDLMPDSVARRIKLAELYSKENMYADATREFTAAAAYLRNAGRMDDYTKVAERLLFHSPENLEAIKELSRYYLKAGETQRALPRLQVGFKVDHKDPELLDLLAEAFAALRKTDKSIAVLKEMSRLYVDRGALAAARSVAQRILALDPSDADARAMLSQAGPLRQPEVTTGSLQAMVLNSPVPQPLPSSNSNRNAMPLSGFSGRLTPAGGLASPGRLGPPMTSTVSARLTPAAGSSLSAPPVTAEEEAARLIAEADSFLRFGLAKKAMEHLQEALGRSPGLRPVRERLIKLYESQREYKTAIAELRVLLSQCSLPHEEVYYLREILRLDAQDQEAERRLKVITGMHRVNANAALAADDFDEPEISVTTTEEELRKSLAPASTTSSMATTSEVPIAEFRKYVEQMNAPSSPQMAQPTRPLAVNSAADVHVAIDLTEASDEVPQIMPSADTNPNAAAIEAAAEELALTSGTLKEELDEVDFCLQQKMYADARRLLKALAGRYPHSKTVAAKLLQLENPRAEVVIDVDMADVHEELILSGSTGFASADSASAASRSRPPGMTARSPSSASAPNRGAGLSSQRSQPGEFAPSSSASNPSTRSLRPGQRSLPPPPPRPSRQMKTLGSADASGAFRLGVSHRNRGQYEQAIIEFEKALCDTKRGARAALMTGLCYRDQNRIKEAIESFKLGIHMPGISDNDLGELNYQLGRSFEMLFDAKEAIHFYQSAMRRDGRFRDAAERIAALQKSLAKK